MVDLPTTEIIEPEKFDCLLLQAISAKDIAPKIKEILVRLIRVSKNHRFHQSFDLMR